jgi:hypothetical protein
MKNMPDDTIPIDDWFHNKQLASTKIKTPWLVDLANFIVAKVMPQNFMWNKRRNYFMILDNTFGVILFFV